MTLPKPQNQPRARCLTVPEIRALKHASRKLSMVTCYDASFARLVSESPIDLLLVGDSSAMVMEGHDSTLHATVESICGFTRAVASGTAGKKFIVSDMPFLSNRLGIERGTEAAGALLRSGAHAVKIEGIRGNEDLIKHLVDSGIPVMGHLGLTPQFVNAFGGMKVQAKTREDQDRLLHEAFLFEACGAFALVLECVPMGIASQITTRLKIPTIGIGAGPSTDGQVLVLQDLLGFNPDFQPKFLRKYLEGHRLILEALEKYHQEVTEMRFPSEEESYP
jgi:3-methyl-2-oxobutanoate hydroxymethyltransferase